MTDASVQLSKLTLELVAAPTLEAAWVARYDPEPAGEPAPWFGPFSYAQLVRVMAAFPEPLTAQERLLAERISSYHTGMIGERPGCAWESPPQSDEDRYLLVDTRQLRDLLRRTLPSAEGAQPAEFSQLRQALDFVDHHGATHSTAVLVLDGGW